MKNHRFLWLRNRTTDNRKCEKARNIKEKRTIEMFNTASKPPVARLSSPSANLLKIPETQGLIVTSNYFVAENGVTRRSRRFSAFIGCLCDNIGSL